MKPLPIISVILIILLAIGSVAYLTAGHIAIFIAGKANNLDISYEGMTHEGFHTFDFTNLTATDTKTGTGIFAKRALVKPGLQDVFQDLLAGRMTIDITMAEVNFTRREPEKKESLDSIEGLVSVPFSSQWKYQSVTGQLQTTPDMISTRDLMITGDQIKLKVTGDLHTDCTVAADITIYFANELLRKIPEDMIRMVLKDEGDGWRTFSVKLAGNYNDPSIEITGRQFRLSIGLSTA